MPFGGFELAVRAILGQKITVAAARTEAQRLLVALGEPLDTPLADLNRVLAPPLALAQLDAQCSAVLGWALFASATVSALASAAASGQLVLDGSADLHSTLVALKALPGVGHWTAQCIAMRARRWPGAFVAGDVALHKALGVQGNQQPARLAEAASVCKPWRSYAVIRVRSGAGRGAHSVPALRPEATP